MISPRLDMILKNVISDSVADIGTDHAYIPIELAKRGARVIATDINAGPLHAAEKNVKNSGAHVTLALGDGLLPIRDTGVKEIIIAGMGGELIEKILSDSMETAASARLILQPMRSQAELRKFLLGRGFGIVSEDLAAEGHKIYNLIIAEKGAKSASYTELDLHLPPILYDHPLFPVLVAKKEREFAKQFSGMSRSKDANAAELQRLSLLLSGIRELKKRGENI